VFFRKIYFGKMPQKSAPNGGDFMAEAETKQAVKPEPKTGVKPASKAGAKPAAKSKTGKGKTDGAPTTI